MTGNTVTAWLVPRLERWVMARRARLGQGGIASPLIDAPHAHAIPDDNLRSGGILGLT